MSRWYTKLISRGYTPEEMLSWSDRGHLMSGISIARLGVHPRDVRVDGVSLIGYWTFDRDSDDKKFIDPATNELSKTRHRWPWLRHPLIVSDFLFGYYTEVWF